MLRRMLCGPLLTLENAVVAFSCMHVGIAFAKKRMH